MATARPICPHSNGGSLVQASRWRLHLLVTHHLARSRSGRPYSPALLAAAPATPIENLQDPHRKCVDNLEPLERGSTEKKTSECQKNAKVGLGDSKPDSHLLFHVFPGVFQVNLRAGPEAGGNLERRLHRTPELAHLRDIGHHNPVQSVFIHSLD